MPRSSRAMRSTSNVERRTLSMSARSRAFSPSALAMLACSPATRFRAICSSPMPLWRKNETTATRAKTLRISIPALMMRGAVRRRESVVDAAIGEKCTLLLRQTPLQRRPQLVLTALRIGVDQQEVDAADAPQLRFERVARLAPLGAELRDRRLPFERGRIERPAIGVAQPCGEAVDARRVLLRQRMHPLHDVRRGPLAVAFRRVDERALLVEDDHARVEELHLAVAQVDVDEAVGGHRALHDLRRRRADREGQQSEREQGVLHDEGERAKRRYNSSVKRDAARNPLTERYASPG